MLRLFASEVFKEIHIEAPLRKRYAISNHGRLLSFEDTIENGTILKGSQTDGYRILTYKFRDGGKIRNKSLFLYKLVAKYFIDKESDEQVQVIHLDRSRDNDNVKNLKWVTRPEFMEFYRNSPKVQEGKRKLIEFKIKSDGRKLTVTQVMRLKKQILDPNRKTRLKILAKQFGVSEMQVYRIKRGENWGHIKV